MNLEKSKQIAEAKKKLEALEQSVENKQRTTPRLIYTKYLKSDRLAFSKQLQDIMKEPSDTLKLKKLNKLIKIISNKAVGRLASITSKGKKKFTVYNKINETSFLLNKEELENISNATLAVFNSFHADVNKAKALGNYDKQEFTRRADLIAECEVARITNKASNYVARDAGLKYWIWGSSGSNNPREIHEVLYGKKSLVGETPAEGGEFPGELPNCDCQMIFDNK